MVTNRSVPTDVVLPHITYGSVGDAILWLSEVFGFREHYRYGGTANAPDGAQMFLGGAWIQLNCVRTGRASPSQTGWGTQSLTVFVHDVRAHFLTARSAGARIVEDLHETVYGELQYGVEDLEGHHWLFSQHTRDVDPREWGAVLAG